MEDQSWPEAEVGDSAGPGLHFPGPTAAYGLLKSPDGDLNERSPGAQLKTGRMGRKITVSVPRKVPGRTMLSRSALGPL